MKKKKSTITKKTCHACNDSGTMYNGEGPLAEPMPCAYCEKGQETK